MLVHADALMPVAPPNTIDLTATISRAVGNIQTCDVAATLNAAPWLRPRGSLPGGLRQAWAARPWCLYWAHRMVLHPKSNASEEMTSGQQKHGRAARALTGRKPITCALRVVCGSIRIPPMTSTNPAIPMPTSVAPAHPPKQRARRAVAWRRSSSSHVGRRLLDLLRPIAIRLCRARARRCARRRRPTRGGSSINHCPGGVASVSPATSCETFTTSSPTPPKSCLADPRSVGGENRSRCR